MAIGRGGTGTLRSVRNLSVFQFSDAMVLLVTGVVSATLHGSVSGSIPVYYTGAFITLPLLSVIAGISFAVSKRVQNGDSRSEVPTKIAPLMKAYCVCLVLSWPGWFASMLITGIAGICRNSDCSYSVNRTGNFILALVILVCIGIAFFANIMCTMVLYVYCAEIGLSIYGSRRIRVGDIHTSAFTNVTPVTASTECQTVPSPRTSTAQCQTHPAFSVHDTFQPFPDATSPRISNKADVTSPVWTIAPDAIPTEEELLNLTKQYHQGKKTGIKKKKQKQAKYKQSGRNGVLDFSATSLNDSAIFSPSAVHLDTYSTHIDSYGDPGDVLVPGTPRKQLIFHRYGSQSPPSRDAYSPDYMHVHLPNAPSPVDLHNGVSYQVSYRPFERNQTSTPPIRIPTVTPPLGYSPPSPTLVTAWPDSSSGSHSHSPVRCNSPQPGSSFSSDTPFGEPYLPTLQTRYVPTPPPSTSPRPKGVLYTHDFDDDDSPPFTP